MGQSSAVDLWDGRYKIPWDDPEFSRRMLAEHVSQDHDMASRKAEMIDAQVRWLHEHACGDTPRRVLDLACGPGFYSAQLAALGHTCYGIDFGPASIEYARRHAAGRSEFVLGDIRTAAFGGGHDVAIFVYGEFNVFPPEEIRAILAKVRRAVRPDGLLVVETQTFAAVQESGCGPSAVYDAEPGLFSDSPHRVSIESTWYAEPGVAQQRFGVIDLGTGTSTAYRSTTKAWTDQEIAGLLQEAGFACVRIASDWPSHTPDLQLVVAR